MIPALLDELLRASAPSGSEEDVMAIVRREAAAFASVESDVHGNTVARVAGTPVGLVSVPLRSMHTPNEIVQLSDVDAASRLAEAYVRASPLDVSFVR